MGLEVEVVGENNKFDVIVIGGGIAGMVSSLFIAEQKLKTCFIEKNVPGGKLMFIEKIHCLPDYENFKGSDLALNIFEQTTSNAKAKYLFGEVTNMSYRNKKFYLFTNDNQTWETKALIIATGTSIKKLNLINEDKYFNKGISYCVLCDGVLAKNKKIVLIGKCDHLSFLKEQTKDIKVFKVNEIKGFEGDDKHLLAVVKIDGSRYFCDHVFIDNGFESNLNFLLPEINKTEQNEIIINEQSATNFPGVFAAGDCTNNHEKLIINAINQAKNAAKSAINFINQKK